MLEIKDLCFAYPHKKMIIQGLTLTIEPGFTFLIGENGSGKTTLLKLIAGILPSLPGSIMLNEFDCGTEKYKEDLAYLPQEFKVYPGLKTKEILGFVAELRGIKRKLVQREIDTVSTKTNITEYLTTKFKHCSGGIQRRIGIACTMIGDQELVLLDEPTVGIDPKERTKLYETLKTCFAGKTVIISTHILDDIEVLADKILMLDRGGISYYGTYNNFKNSLQGKLYTTSLPLETITKDTSIKVLSSSTNDLRTVYRVFSANELPSNDYEHVIATNDDIWTYF